ncbi:MAG: sigma-70 family RNA polymerase sigma factor [Gemmatimonadaceae bacterium]|nr:sigma-70 family RNA polymerase sigma factor [Gemmatimonadaceae bacterium]
MHDSGAEPDVANDRRGPPSGDVPVVLRLVRHADASGPASDLSEAPEGELSPALEDVVRRFGTFIRRTAHRHRLASSEIEDVVQETRIRLWKALGTSERIAGAPATYIHRTAMSAALDFLRRRRARREEPLVTREIDGGGATSTSLLSPYDAEERVNTTDVETAVARAVDALVESRRAVVRMYLAGYDREEIADLLGWSEAKTRNLLYRGLSDLRATLASWGYGPGAT